MSVVAGLLGYFQDFQLTWDYFFDQLVAGLTLGSLYGLIAIGYSMVYGILKLLNFAHGEVFMIGSYIGFFVLTWLRRRSRPEPADRTRDRPHVPAVAMLGAGLLGVTIERFAYRPLREKRASRIAPLISALGVSFFLQQLAVICFGADAEAVRRLLLRRRLVLHQRHHRAVRDPVHAAVRDHDHGLPHGRADDLHRAHTGRVVRCGRRRSTSRPRR